MQVLVIFSNQYKKIIFSSTLAQNSVGDMMAGFTGFSTGHVHNKVTLKFKFIIEEAFFFNKRHA